MTARVTYDRSIQQLVDEQKCELLQIILFVCPKGIETEIAHLK